MPAKVIPPTTIESETALAVSWGRFPPVQTNSPDSRGARACWNSNRSMARLPAASRVSRLPLSRTAPRARPPSGTQVGRGVALLLGDGEQQRVEADEAVRHQGEFHLAGVRGGPSQAARAGRRRALPLRVGGIHLDDAVPAPTAREDAVERPLAQPAPGERELHFAFRRPEGVDAAADAKLAGQGAGEIPPHEGAQVEPGESEQQPFRAPVRRQQGGQAVGLEVADLAAELGVHLQSREGAGALEPAADLAAGLQRGEGAPDPVEGERLQGHVGGESQGIESGVEMDQPDGHARGTVAVVVARGALERDVAQRALERAVRGETSLEDHRGRDEADRAEVHVRAADLEPGEYQTLLAPGADATFARDRAHRVSRHPGVGERPVDPHVQRVEEARARDAPRQRTVERQRVEVGPDRVEIEIPQLEPHVADAEAPAPVGQRHQLAAHLLRARAELELADVVLVAGAAQRARGQHAAPGHGGEVGRDPAEVLQVDVRRDKLEVVEDRVLRPGHRPAAGEPGVGQRAALQAEHRAVPPEHHAARRVAQRDGRIVDPGGEGVEIDGERLPIRRRDPETGEPGGEVGEHDHPAQPLGTLFDDPAGLRPLRLQRGILRGLGLQRPAGVPRQRDPERPTVQPHVVEVHQRRLAAGRAFAQPEHLLEIHPAAAVLDELDHGTLELHRAQHHLARDQVGQLVSDSHPRQVREQHAAGVADHEILEYQVVEERARDRPHLDVAQDHPVEHAGDGAGEEIAARRREDHGGHHAQDHGDRSQEGDEQEARQLPPHQNGCPTATWKVNLLSRSRT